VYSADDLAFGLPNGLGPEVTAMAQADADFVVGCIDLNGMQTLAEELQRQGLADVPMMHSNTYDAEFVRAAGDLFEGDVIGVGFRPFEADAGDSTLDEFLEWMDRTGGQVTEQAMVGWINADLAYQGLVAAGPDFDRASVIEATNEMTEYTAGGLIPPIDWSRQHEPPTEDDPVTHGSAQECTAYVTVRDGEMELIGDPEAPWSCWDPAEEGWTEPEPTDFE
jgi:ABC-type branched-subunit amino acid transport system substrate-binding protein